MCALLRYSKSWSRRNQFCSTATHSKTYVYFLRSVSSNRYPLLAIHLFREVLPTHRKRIRFTAYYVYSVNAYQRLPTAYEFVVTHPQKRTFRFLAVWKQKLSSSCHLDVPYLYYRNLSGYCCHIYVPLRRRFFEITDIYTANSCMFLSSCPDALSMATDMRRLTCKLAVAKKLKESFVPSVRVWCKVYCNDWFH